MTTLKKLLLIFFLGLGIHRVVQDLLLLIDPGFTAVRNSGYFSVIGFVILYFAIKYLHARDELTGGETKTTN